MFRLEVLGLNAFKDVCLHAFLTLLLSIDPKLTYSSWL